MRSALTSLGYSEERCSVNKWGAPNKKRDASSNTALARIVKMNATASVQISEKWCEDQKQEYEPGSQACSPRRIVQNQVPVTANKGKWFAWGVKKMVGYTSA